jgi:hypothetical protein
MEPSLFRDRDFHLVAGSGCRPSGTGWRSSRSGCSSARTPTAASWSRCCGSASSGPRCWSPASPGCWSTGSRRRGMSASGRPARRRLPLSSGGLELAMLVAAATFAAVAVAARMLRIERPPGELQEGELAPRARDGIACLYRDSLLALVMTVAYASMFSVWTVGMALGALLLSRRVAATSLAVAGLVAATIQGPGAGPARALAQLRLLPRLRLRRRHRPRGQERDVPQPHPRPRPRQPPRPRLRRLQRDPQHRRDRRLRRRRPPPRHDRRLRHPSPTPAASPPWSA